MKSLSSAWGGFLAAVTWAGIAAGCARPEIAEPRAPAKMPGDFGEASVTTTTSAQPAAAAARPSTSSMNVSSEIANACDIHFGEVKDAPKFDFDRSLLRADDDAVLDQVARCLTAGPLRGRRLELVGRADPRGEAEYNLSLGGYRAASVEQYLKALGVDPSRIESTSRGKLDATGTDEPGWQQDRRVDLNLR